MINENISKSKIISYIDRSLDSKEMMKMEEVIRSQDSLIKKYGEVKNELDLISSYIPAVKYSPKVMKSKSADLAECTNLVYGEHDRTFMEKIKSYLSSKI